MPTQTGTIKTIHPQVQIATNFCKREFVLLIDQDKQYPSTIIFELHNTFVDIIDPYTEGQEVTVDYNLKGRQHTNNQGEVKTYNTLVAWKIQPVNTKP